MTHAQLSRTLPFVLFALVSGAGSGCKRSSPAAGKTQPAKVTSALASAASATAPAPSASAAEVDPELASVLQQWNEATNAGDGKALAQLYAPQLSLYGRFETNARAVAAKVNARQQEPSFEQAISAVRWGERADGAREAQFDKRSRSAKGERTVHAYLLLRRFGGKFRIVDEGEVRRTAARRSGSEPELQSRDHVHGEDVPRRRGAALRAIHLRARAHRELRAVQAGSALRSLLHGHRAARRPLAARDRRRDVQSAGTRGRAVAERLTLPPDSRSPAIQTASPSAPYSRQWAGRTQRRFLRPRRRLSSPSRAPPR
jgi:hypothetical protein